MDAFKEMKAVVDKRKQEEVLSKESYNKSSKDRLTKILEKKMQTCFIGPISQIENFFGSLWGKGKQKKNLTTDELKWLEVWNNVRTVILNNGNNQIRNMYSELNQYTTTWNRYNYQFNKEENQCLNERIN